MIGRFGLRRAARRKRQVPVKNNIRHGHRGCGSGTGEKALVPKFIKDCWCNFVTWKDPNDGLNWGRPNRTAGTHSFEKHREAAKEKFERNPAQGSGKNSVPDSQNLFRLPLLLKFPADARQRIKSGPPKVLKEYTDRGINELFKETVGEKIQNWLFAEKTSYFCEKSHQVH